MLRVVENSTVVPSMPGLMFVLIPHGSRLPADSLGMNDRRSFIAPALALTACVRSDLSTERATVRQ